eukprot:SAG22_NODE_183_length_16031_cov_36.647000_1_plen_174_part_00
MAGLAPAWSLLLRLRWVPAYCHLEPHSRPLWSPSAPGTGTMTTPAAMAAPTASTEVVLGASEDFSRLFSAQVRLPVKSSCLLLSVPPPFPLARHAHQPPCAPTMRNRRRFWSTSVGRRQALASCSGCTRPTQALTKCGRRAWRKPWPFPGRWWHPARSTCSRRWRSTPAVTWR